MIYVWQYLARSHHSLMPHLLTLSRLKRRAFYKRTRGRFVSRFPLGELFRTDSKEVKQGQANRGVAIVSHTSGRKHEPPEPLRTRRIGGCTTPALECSECGRTSAKLGLRENTVGVSTAADEISESPGKATPNPSHDVREKRSLFVFTLHYVHVGKPAWDLVRLLCSRFCILRSCLFPCSSIRLSKSEARELCCV